MKPTKESIQKAMYGNKKIPNNSESVEGLLREHSKKERDD